MDQPILTRPGHHRLVFHVAIAQLSKIVMELEEAGAQLEHVYDY